MGKRKKRAGKSQWTYKMSLLKKNSRKAEEEGQIQTE